MTNEITGALDTHNGIVFGAVVASGSVVAGDLVSAYQTSTDDMFDSADNQAYDGVGSVAILRGSIGALPDKTCVGIVLTNGTSGDSVNVTTEGIFLATTTGQVTAGNAVMPLGQGVIDYNDDASGAGYIIGRAITGASAASKFVLMKLDI